VGKTASLNIWRRLAQRRTSGDDRATDCLRVWYEDTYLSLSCVCQASLVHASGLQGSPWPNAWRYASEEGCVTTPVGDGARSRCNLVLPIEYGCLVIRDALVERLDCLEVTTYTNYHGDTLGHDVHTVHAGGTGKCVRCHRLNAHMASNTLPPHHIRRCSHGLSLDTSENMFHSFINYLASFSTTTKLSQPTSTLIICVVMQDALS